MTVAQFLVEIADAFEAQPSAEKLRLAKRCRDYSCIALQLEEDARKARRERAKAARNAVAAPRSENAPT